MDLVEESDVIPKKVVVAKKKIKKAKAKPINKKLKYGKVKKAKAIAKKLKKYGKIIKAKQLTLHIEKVNKDSVCIDIIQMQRIDIALAMLQDETVDGYDKNIYNLVIEKRNKIYDNTGFLVPIKILVEQAIRNGIEKLNNETL